MITRTSAFGFPSTGTFWAKAAAAAANARMALFTTGLLPANGILQSELQTRFRGDVNFLTLGGDLGDCARARAGACSDRCAFTASRDRADDSAGRSRSADHFGAAPGARAALLLHVHRIHVDHAAVHIDLSKTQREDGSTGQLAGFLIVNQLH